MHGISSCSMLKTTVIAGRNAEAVGSSPGEPGQAKRRVRTLEPMNGYERKIIHVACKMTRKYGRKAKAKIRTVTSSFIIKDKV